MNPGDPLRQRRIIRVDGTEQLLTRPHSLEELGELIGCRHFDAVNLHRWGPPLMVMLVDDNGYETRIEERPGVIETVPVRALRPVNEKATQIYHQQCKPGTTHQIVGDVAIVPDSDFA